MEKIEELEQLLLQHMRTAGLRSNKESGLVEEILDLRKERRKLFAQLTEKNRELIQENEFIKEQHRLADQKQEQIVKVLKEQHELELSKREDEFQQKELLLREEIQLLKENHKLTEQREIEALKHNYESKFTKLEMKLRQLLKEKEINDLTRAKQMAEKFLKKSLTEIEAEHEKRLEEYKAALRSIAEREKDLQGSNQRYRDLTETLKAEHSKLNSMASSLQDKLELMFKREKELELANQELYRKYQDAKKKIQDLQEQIDSHEQKQSQQMNEINQLHEKKLEEIDEKIRKMIQTKNLEITKLQQRIQQQEQQYKELEETLMELNRNLNSIR